MRERSYGWLGLLFFDGSSGPPFAATAIAHFIAANGDQLDVVLVGSIEASLVATPAESSRSF
jgi:hypothetical protein